jgi:hypothetical protein
MYPFDGFDAVAIWNGLWSSDRPWNADNDAALAEWGRALAAGIRGGRWLPAMGNSDTHLEGQIGIPHTVVLAEELSTGAILAGIRAGRSWIAGSAAVELSVQVSAADRSAGIGEQLETCGASAVVRVEVGGVPSGTVSFHTDRGTVHRESLPSDGSGAVQWHTSSGESAFVRIEVRHPGRHAARTAPGTGACPATGEYPGTRHIPAHRIRSSASARSSASKPSRWNFLALKARTHRPEAQHNCNSCFVKARPRELWYASMKAPL